MGHLHHFGTPVEGEPHARQCNTCGERQRYQPPIGKGVTFDDVLVPIEDLRTVLVCVGQYENSEEQEEVLRRVTALLDD